jgi:hypothetical protein
MAEPAFQIHRIVLIRDSFAFNCWRKWGSPRTDSYFTYEGAFFRRMDTIRKHLGWLRDGDGYDLKSLDVETFTVTHNTRKITPAAQVLPVVAHPKGGKNDPISPRPRT